MQPLFQIVLPVGTDDNALGMACTTIASLRAQIYPHWRLAVVVEPRAIPAGEARDRFAAELDRIADRVEVDDTIHVRAQDPSAIAWIGFEVDTNSVRMKFDSLYVGAGNLTDVTHNFTLGLQGLQPLPRTIVVKGYACDAAVAQQVLRRIGN